MLIEFGLSTFVPINGIFDFFIYLYVSESYSTSPLYLSIFVTDIVSKFESIFNFSFEKIDTK